MRPKHLERCQNRIEVTHEIHSARPRVDALPTHQRQRIGSVHKPEQHALDGQQQLSLTVSQNGVVTASMLLPAETFVMASFRNEDGMRELSPGRSEFRGPVTLSILPRATMPEGNQWLINIREIMGAPPLTLTVSNAEVLVERTEP